MRSKAELGRIAQEVRDGLRLGDHDAFDPLAWSNEWGIPFVSLADVRDLIGERAYLRFTQERPETWSAALVAVGRGYLVAYNPAHSPQRVLSDLAHEAAHFVAEHVLTSAWMQGERSCGAGSRDQEAEAAELAGRLLVPMEQAKIWAIRGYDPSGLADRYGVSLTMAKWRMNKSGGAVIRQRFQAKRQFPPRAS